MTEKFNVRLKTMMDQKGMKPIELSTKSGISKSAISQYLAGLYTPKQDNVYKLALALDVSPSYLMGLEPHDESASGTGPEREELRAAARRIEAQFSPADAKAINSLLDVLLSQKENQKG